MKTLVKQSLVNVRNNLFKIIYGLLLLFVIICIVANPTKYSKIAFKGLEVWVKILVPTLLPFFILTKLFASSGMIQPLTVLFAPVTKKLYKCPKISAYVFLMSILTGYPVGSKLVADLYNSGQISKNDAIKTTSFTSNSGPMFILGSVGIGMFANKTMGIIILISHIIGALLNGLIYRNIKYEKTFMQNNYISTQNTNFSETIMSSINSILLIGGVICFSFVLVEVITTSSLFNNFLNVISFGKINKEVLTSIFCGIGEITKGCLMLSQTILSKQIATILSTFIISFGGVSTILQAMAFLKNIVPTKVFVLQKITHALCSTFVCVIICLFVHI